MSSLWGHPWDAPLLHPRRGRCVVPSRQGGRRGDEPGHPSLRSSSAPVAPSPSRSKKNKNPAEPIAGSHAQGQEQPQVLLVGFGS